MMNVRVSQGPEGPRLHVTSADRRINELSVELSSLGIAHAIDYQTAYRSSLIIPVTDGRKREEAKAKL